ncbi:MAG: hypothetical protein IJZ06_06055 [Bacteroidales bacterium]|nr:hypothetical protein [Bacteroidales bacterium]
MNKKFPLIRYIKAAFDILSSKDEVNEPKMDEVLFECMYPYEYMPVYNHVEHYYNSFVSEDISAETRKKRFRKNTIELLNLLQPYDYQYLPNFDVIKHTFLYEILRSDILPIARRYATERKYDGFDFEVYRHTKSVSQVSEMNEIRGYSTKKILIEWYLVKFITEVYEGICIILNKEDIIDKSIFAKIVIPAEDYPPIMEKIRCICTGEFSKIKTEISVDNQKLLGNYCKVYPDLNKNIKHLIEILDMIKYSMNINPTQCKKKRFSAIVYILYRSKRFLGIKPNKLVQYTDFKSVMCKYYGMPEGDSYKPKDVRNLAKEIRYKYSCFNDIKIDEEYRGEFSD